LGSAVGMDKVAAKQLLVAAGLPHARWLTVRDDEVGPGLAARVERELGWPVFVKPANLGSSVGVSKVRSAEELRDAVALAHSYDELAVIEEAVSGREIEVAVLGNREPEAAVPGEIVPGNEFYDYEDKYVDDSARYLVPGPLSDGDSAE